MKLIELVEEEYAHIEERQDKKIEYEKDIVYRICDAFEGWLSLLIDRSKHLDERFNDEANKEYRGLFKILKKKFEEKKQEIYTQNDLTQFSLRIHEYADHKYFSYTGLFLSALIQAHEEFTHTKEPYMLNLSKEENNRLIDYIGHSFSHVTLLIKGSVGKYLGYNMQSGWIAVSNSSSDDTGLQNDGGIIHLLGNTGDFVGEGMKRGKIIVEGNCGKNVGGLLPAFGGVIKINGSYESINSFYQSSQSKIYHREREISAYQLKIYHKGIPIFPEDKK